MMIILFGLVIMDMLATMLKNSSGVTSSYLVSPVVALSADVKVTGSGTQTDPYVMQ